jgi:hypothetical protein
MRFLVGILVGAAAIVGGAIFLASTGRIDVAAARHGGWNDRIDHWLFTVSTRSIEKHAAPATNPFAADPLPLRGSSITGRTASTATAPATSTPRSSRRD